MSGAGRRLGSVALVWAAGFGALRVSFLAPEACPAFDAGRAGRAAAAAGDWLARGQTGNGRYLYEYDRDRDGRRPGYNLVRHAGVTMSLYQLAGVGPGEALVAADLALREMVSLLAPAGNGRALAERGARTASLGASALMVAALVDRREVTGDTSHDDVARALGRFMVGQVTASGQTLSTFDLQAGVPVPGVVSRYATGEAGWALARLHRLFPGEGWDRPAFRIADYLATRRDEAENLDFRPWPDQWAAYLLAELPPHRLGPHHLDYARALAERFGMLVRVESQKGGWPVPFVDPRARAAGLGVWAEGLGSLTRLARAHPALAPLAPALGARLDCGAGLLVGRQVTDPAAPGEERGAWFREGLTRMDDQQHAISGLLEAVALVGQERR